MIGEIEKGFAVGFGVLSLLETVIHCGTDNKDLPHERSALIIDAVNVQHVTKALWSGQILFRMNSPAIKRDIELHKTNVLTLKTFLADSNSVNAAFASSLLACRGIWITGITPAQEEMRWITEIECQVGLQEI